MFQGFGPSYMTVAGVSRLHPSESWWVEGEIIRVLLFKNPIGSIWLVYYLYKFIWFLSFISYSFSQNRGRGFSVFYGVVSLENPETSRKTHRSKTLTSFWPATFFFQLGLAGFPAAWSKHPSNIATFPATCWVEIGETHSALLFWPLGVCNKFPGLIPWKIKPSGPTSYAPDSITVGTWAVGYDMFDLCIVLWSFQSTSLGL